MPHYDPKKFKEALKMIENGGIVCEVSATLWGCPRAIYRQVDSQGGAVHERYKEAREKGDELRRLEIGDRKSREFFDKRQSKMRDKATAFLKWTYDVSAGSLLGAADKEHFGHKGGAKLWLDNLPESERKDNFQEAYLKARESGDRARRREIGLKISRGQIRKSGRDPNMVPRGYCTLCGKPIERRFSRKFTIPTGHQKIDRFCSKKCKDEWLGVELSQSETAMAEILDFADEHQIPPTCAGWLLTGKLHRAPMLASSIQESRPASLVLERYNKALYRPMMRKVCPMPPPEWRQILDLYESGSTMKDALSQFGLRRNTWDFAIKRARETGPPWFPEEVEASKEKRKILCDQIRNGIK